MLTAGKTWRWPSQSREDDGREARAARVSRSDWISLLRHARAWRGHPRLASLRKRRGWHRNSGLPELRIIGTASRVNPTCSEPGHDADCGSMW